MLHATTRNAWELIAQATTRGALWPIEQHMRHIGRRGRVTRAEVAAMRVAADTYFRRPVFRAAHGTKVRPVDIAHDGGRVVGEWVERGRPTRDHTVLLYVHGGAFIAFSPRTHRGLVSELAARTGRSVFSVDYRLAPEHRFPAAADDVLRAYAWLLASGVAAERIVVAGDSAGGHLALGLTPRAVRAGLPAPAAVVALSPVVDPSMQWSVECERRLSPDRTTSVAEAGVSALGVYIHGTDPESPELLLTGDDLSVMPPTLLQVSEHEMLLDDSLRYRDALLAAGGEVELQSWPHKTHVFQMGWRASSTASAAVDKVSGFITTRVRI